MQAPVETCQDLAARAYRAAVLMTCDETAADRLAREVLDHAADCLSRARSVRHLERNVFSTFARRVERERVLKNGGDDVLEALDARQRLCVALRHGAALDADDVADAMGVATRECRKLERTALDALARSWGVADGNADVTSEHRRDLAGHLVKEVNAIALPCHLQAVLQQGTDSARRQSRWKRFLPAVLAAGLSALVIAALGALALRERMTRFPGYERVADLGDSADRDALSKATPVSLDSMALADWVLINRGAEGFSPGEDLAGHHIKALRAGYAGQALVVTAWLEQPRDAVLAVFDADALGVDLKPLDTWHKVAGDGWVGAARGRGTRGVLVLRKGRADRFIEALGASGEAPDGAELLRAE